MVLGPVKVVETGVEVVGTVRFGGGRFARDKTSRVAELL